jgi:hypothetical protein
MIDRRKEQIDANFNAYRKKNLDSSERPFEVFDI